MIYQVDYYGFVYIWFDRLRRKFYIGSHLGSLSDRYISSSTRLNFAYKKRPLDFKRRILFMLSIKCLKTLHIQEQKWLDLIKDYELMTSESVMANTFKYYNMKKIASGGNGSANKGKGHTAWNKGLDKSIYKLRADGLVCLLSDKPKSKIKNKRKIRINFYKTPKHKKIHVVECQTCTVLFFHFKNRKTCSKSCAGKRTWILGTGKSNFIKGGDAWNKGMTNPIAANNGRKSAKKQSATVTGRRKRYNPDGSWSWYYPVKKVGE